MSSHADNWNGRCECWIISSTCNRHSNGKIYHKDAYADWPIENDFSVTNWPIKQRINMNVNVTHSRPADWYSWIVTFSTDYVKFEWDINSKMKWFTIYWWVIYIQLEIDTKVRRYIQYRHTCNWKWFHSIYRQHHYEIYMMREWKDYLSMVYVWHWTLHYGLVALTV